MVSLKNGGNHGNQYGKLPFGELGKMPQKLRYHFGDLKMPLIASYKKWSSLKGEWLKKYFPHGVRADRRGTKNVPLKMPVVREILSC